MTATTLVISEIYRRMSPEFGSRSVETMTVAGSGVPSPDFLDGFDAIVVLDSLESPDLGRELGGALAAAVSRGKRVTVAFNVRTEPSQQQLLGRLGVHVLHSVPGGDQVRTVAAAFEDYMTRYGVSAQGFGPDNEDVAVEPLAWMSVDMPTGDVAPAAARFAGARGSVYVVPFHVADLVRSHDALMQTMLDATAAYETAARGTSLLPPYLGGLRLPGEEAVIETVGRLGAELADAEAEAARLRSFRSITGPGSGAALERLVIEALNVILAGSGYSAVDRPDAGAEDFWIVGPDGDFALAEVKGINTSVRRTHINQVDDHRSQLGRDDGQPPGLLVVNVNRGSEDLAAKQEEVHPDIRAHAVRQNVLLVTGFDLYQLLALALSGHNAGDALISGLSAGGGWLKVRASAAERLT
jgi:hypothetical protein